MRVTRSALVLSGIGGCYSHSGAQVTEMQQTINALRAENTQLRERACSPPTGASATTADAAPREPDAPRIDHSVSATPSDVGPGAHVQPSDATPGARMPPSRAHRFALTLGSG